ncbi:high-temperature-induced dauer-formation protein-domain-containing protein [Myxozyma melibiosi]|uniref:High-temperature-induced dauer-formation protein-domain-containing protein n=1 Tax=Myxozyma melibiosi TaxID=54550 RepID=A0ABR1F964_9ASCO
MGSSNSKLIFKQSVFRLFEEPELSPSDPLWEQFWQVPESAEDIFTIFSASDVRRTRDNALGNLELLIVNVVHHLAHLLRNSQLYYSENAQAQAQASNAASGGQASAAAEAAVDGNEKDAARATRETLNCMRVLTRVLPFIYEKPDLEEWRDELFWGMGQPLPEIARHPDAADGATEQSGDDADEEEEEDRPLGSLLMDTLTDFLFLPGFALPIVLGKDSTVAYTIWETGIGSTTPVGTTSQLEANKIETLRTIITVLSEAMYHYPGVLPTKGVRFISYMVCNPDKRVVLSVLCSLLNTVMKYNPGWRVSYISAGSLDPRQLLVTYCFQLLLILVTYSIPDGEDIVSLGIHIEESAETPTVQTVPDMARKYLKNWYKYYLGRLHRIQDLQFLADGISRLLNQPMQSATSFLPGSQTQIEWAPELIMLFWDLVRHNSRFRNYIISSDRIHDFVVLLLYYSYTYRQDASKVGLVRLCIYVLLTISADSVFSVRLNKTFDSHNALPSSMRIPGWDESSSYADYLLLAIYCMINTNNDKLAALYPSLLDVQVNLAPHISNINRLTCSRMMQLFSALSAPSFLVANSTNYILADKLLEAMESMIVNSNHQSNANLLYTIFRSRKKFEALKELTFERCLEESRRHRPMAAGDISDRKGEVAVLMEDGAEAGRGKSKGKTAVRDVASPLTATSSSSSLSAGDNSASSTYRSGKAEYDANGYFTPTQEWFDGWHSKLHLQVICHLLEVLPGYIPRLNTIRGAPSVSSAATSPTRVSRDAHPDTDVISALRHLDDETMLPSSFNRTFQEPIGFEWTVAAKGWYYSVLWGSIYVMHEIVASADGAGANGIVAAVAGAGGVGASTVWCGIWRGTNVQLFKVQETKVDGPSLLRPRGAVDAVAKSMLERLNVGGGKARQQGSGSGGS